MAYFKNNYLLLSFLSMLYFIAFSYFAWNLSYQYQDSHLLLMIKFIIGGTLFLTPYVFFIAKNAENNILNIKNYSNIGLLALGLGYIIFVFFMSFTMGIIGKGVTNDGLLGLFKYSFLPPMMMIYVVPFATYSYSRNKDSFHEGLNNFLNIFKNYSTK
jgi:hypothetical protein